MSLVRPLARSITQPISLFVLIAWAGVMALVVNRSYLQASTNLATDLARYGSSATWRGVYYRGEKIGFTVSQTEPKGNGFDLEEDGRLQMSLLGATTAATIHTVAHVDADFTLRAFDMRCDSCCHRLFGRVLQLGLQRREQRACFRRNCPSGGLAYSSLNLLFGLRDQSSDLPGELN